VVMVNEAMVRRYWPEARGGSAEPLGRRLQLDDKWLEIVGVTSDVKYDGLEKEASAEIYVPFQALPAAVQSLVVRTGGDAMALVRAVRAAVWSVDRDQPLEHIQSLEQVIYQSVSAPRFRMVLLAIFAGLGLVLAAIGIYGVIAYAVAQRTNEIGIRRALGAREGQVLRMVMLEGITLAAAGVALGIAGAVAVTRGLRSFLFGVTPTDVWTLVNVSVLLMAVTAAASLIPARRATKVDPMDALRWE
jgi:putative ABC transport system permease protein